MGLSQKFGEGTVEMKLGDKTQGTVGCLPPLHNKSDNRVVEEFSKA